MTRIGILRAPSLLAALGLVVAGCGPSTPPPGQMPPAAVVVNQPLERDVMEWDEYQARLEAVEMVEIRARVTGYLQSVNFKDGAEIQKGDLLFVIDPRPYQADADRAAAELNQAESRLELAKNEQARAERLLKSKAISEEEADTRSKARREAEAALQSARASVETAKLNLEYTRVTAPISGRIGRRLVTEGNLVNGNQGQSTLLATIVSLDPIYAYFDADESSVLKYQQLAREGKGDALRDGKVVCQLELANEAGFPHSGLLDFVDNRVDPTTGTLRARGIFTNPGPDRILQPGYFSRVRVPGTPKAAALLIPDLAVGTDQGQKYVLVVNSTNAVEYRTVKLGPIFEGLRVVRGGLKASDWIVVNGLMSAIPGSIVNPTRAVLTNAPEPVAAASRP